ncbi:hypothetical protein [Burkholderia pseudomallei]|uniref:hypothetical protein n=1 Tax=Burkholderia pseudomallei TaxID=28450 RepID=UPI0020C40AEC|nr:hypothetical protein [Burkholderia pseudomallei]
MKMPQRRHETADAPAPPADAGVMAVSVSPRIPGGARRLAARRFCRFFRTATNVSGVFAPLRKRRIPHTVAWSARRRGMVSAASAQHPRTVNFIIQRACKTVVLNPINWMRNIPYVIVIANVIGHYYNRSKAGIRYK